MTFEPDERFGQMEAESVLAVLTAGRLWRGNGASWGSSQNSPAGVMADSLEDAMARRLNLPYVHAVNSGTSANEAAIASLGLDPGDEVICPAACPAFVPFAVLATGCIPVFADVNPETLLLDPAKIEPVVGDRTRALVVVHLWGIPAPMTQIMNMASRHGLKVVEDCAQANGTLIDGRPVGTFGEACCYSFQQSKQITCGEGGIFATRSAGAYARAVLYSNCGIPNFRFGVPPPERLATSPESIGRGHLRFGHNHRISEFQAAVALAQLSRIDELLRRRTELAELIEKELNRLGKESVRPIRRPSSCTISYWRYPILVPPGRGNYREIPYLDPAFQRINNDRQTPFGMQIPRHVRYEMGSCPNAESGASQVRSFSIHHSLTEEEVIAKVSKLAADV